MKTTSVSAWPTLAQSMAVTACPVTKVTAEGGRDGLGHSGVGNAEWGGDSGRSRSSASARASAPSPPRPNEWVAALETTVCPRQALDGHGADLGLCEFVSGFLLADVEALGTGGARSGGSVGGGRENGVGLL
jgi:hypothetical protein